MTPKTRPCRFAVIGQSPTPTINVQVPVPTPVPQQPKRVSAPPTQPVPQGGTPSSLPPVPQGAPQQPGLVQPVEPAMPPLGAVILPWYPATKQQMSRQFARVPKGATAPNHMSEFGLRVVNPAHVTYTVRNLARQMYGSTEDEDRANEPPDYAAGYDQRRYYPSDHPEHSLRSQRIRVRTPQPELAPILADALQDAGATDENFLRRLRTADPRFILNDNQYGPGHHGEPVIRSLAYDSPEEIAAKWAESMPRQRKILKRLAEEKEYKDTHAKLIGKGSTLPLGYHIQRKGGGASGMRGNPPPGEIWHRPSYRSGGYSHAAQRKAGRKLTLAEMKTMIAAIRERKRATKIAAKPPTAPPLVDQASAAQTERLSRGQMSRPRRYAAHSPENGRLNSDQLKIATQALASDDPIDWRVLGDHLQENGFPNSGEVISRAAESDGSDWDSRPLRNPREFPSYGHGDFNHRVIRDGILNRRVVTLRIGNSIHHFRMTMPPQQMSRRLPLRKLERPRRYSLADHPSFQSAIVDANLPTQDNTSHSPADYTPHLVYADFLQEQGKDAHADWVRRAVEQAKQRHGSGYSPTGGGVWNANYGVATGPADFRMYGMSGIDREPNRTIDLVGTHANEDDRRPVWTLTLPAAEMKQLHDRVAAEGAHSTVKLSRRPKRKLIRS